MTGLADHCALRVDFAMGRAKRCAQAPAGVTGVGRNVVFPVVVVMQRTAIYAPAVSSPGGRRHALARAGSGLSLSAMEPNELHPEHGDSSHAAQWHAQR